MIGLDLGSKFIKICELERQDNQYRIVTSVIATNPSASGKPSDEQQTKNRLRSVLGQVSLQGRATALSLGGQQVLSRNFTFPSLNVKELEGAVKLEASQTVFSDLSNMCSDFQVLGSSDDGKVEVLYVAAPKPLIDERMKMAEDAGLTPILMDIDNLALANCYLTFDPSAQKNAVVLLNVGNTQTNMCVIERGKLRFVRNVNFGGFNITKEISTVLGISQGKAENLKKRPDLWNNSGLNIKNILRKSMPDLLEGIYRSIEYCRSRKKLVNVDKILLTGGSCFTHGIEGFIYEVFGIDTERWNPLAFIEHTDLKDRQKEVGYYLAIALGLALREKNNV
jgi:type IV pilus assembly protein PilM